MKHSLDSYQSAGRCASWAHHRDDHPLYEHYSQWKTNALRSEQVEDRQKAEAAYRRGWAGTHQSPAAAGKL